MQCMYLKSDGKSPWIHENIVPQTAYFSANQGAKGFVKKLYMRPIRQDHIKMIPSYRAPRGATLVWLSYIYGTPTLFYPPPFKQDPPSNRIRSECPKLIRLFLNHPNKKLDNVFANEIMDTMETNFKLVVRDAGTYTADSFAGLVWMVLRHRLRHLCKGEGWRD